MHVALHRWGLCDYHSTWQRMRAFTEQRDADTGDQIWLLQHHPVFTQGSSCAMSPRGDDIPLIHTDRGGQITYHGPGQLIAYLLLDIKRRKQGVKSLVAQVEQVVIDTLANYSIVASRHAGAPGVYVKHAKIAALGLRIKRGCCFHGLCLNVDMDLTPYKRIDPCGYPDLAITQLREHVPAVDLNEVENKLAEQLLAQFG